MTQTFGGVGIASTTYIKNIIMHNTGLGTARVPLSVTQIPLSLRLRSHSNRFLRLDLAPNETTFFESTYPIVMTHHDSLTVEVTPPDAGGTGIGSAVNFIVNEHGCLIMPPVKSLGNSPLSITISLD